MSAPVVIDSEEFARARRRVSGSLPVSGFLRIGELLADSAGDLDYVAEGKSDNRGRLLLTLRIDGVLHLLCQRCLAPMDYRLETANTLILLPTGSAATEVDGDPDAPECIEASKELNLSELIEDEILLSLPPHPRHAEEVCQRTGAADGARHGANEKWTGLAALKNSGN